MNGVERKDPLYTTLATALAGTALVSIVLGVAVVPEWLQFRVASGVLSLIAAVGLLLRVQPRGRIPALACGSVVLLASVSQLALFVMSGTAHSESTSLVYTTQSSAAGMFCIGAALVLDGILPHRWGRHLLFGMLGAVTALIGSTGIFALITGLAVELDATLLNGMRLPGAVLLLLGGLSLMSGARLRSTGPADRDERPAFEDDLQDRSGLAAALAILLLTLGATLIAWRQAKDQVDRQDAVVRNNALHRFADSLAHTALNAVDLLNGVRGLFAASDNVNASEWQRFFHELPLADQYAGVIAIGYAAQLPADQVDGANVRSPQPAGKRPAIGRDAHDTAAPRMPTIYIMPDTQAARSVLGVDLDADPVLAAMVARARQSGGAALSGRLDFGKYGDPKGRGGFVVALPLTDRIDPSAAEVIGKTGIVFCVVDMDRVVSLAAAGSNTEDLRVEVSDGTDPGDAASLFTSAGFDRALEFDSAVLDLYGRTWTVSAQFSAEAIRASRSRMPAIVLATGLFCALVLFVLTWVLTGLRARASHLANQANRELSRAQRAQQAVTDTATAGIITADSNGNILYMNPSAATGFGVHAKDMEGKSLTVLMPERYREAHCQGMSRIANGEEPRSIGTALELAGLRADGSEFPLELLLSAWASDDQKYFTAIITDITQRKLAELELERRARDLERSNADLEQFAYVASHDLQEPLRMVASYVQLLSRRYSGQLDADADEFIAFAVDGATRMQSLIEDLLAYSRVGRSGRGPIETDVRECAERAIAQLHDAVSRSGAVVRVRCECSVLALPAQVTQVFQNLIANALKFRGESAPEVTIDALLEGSFWRITVTDNGIGIDPRHQERVFAIFQRLHTRREYPGTGIGLAICRKIVESFGGRIWVDSISGKGSTFQFTLPAGGQSE